MTIVRVKHTKFMESIGSGASVVVDYLKTGKTIRYRSLRSVNPSLTIQEDGDEILFDISEQAGGGSSATVITKTGDESSTSTSVVDMADMSVNLDANSSYEIMAMVVFSTAVTTTGLKLGYVAPPDSAPLIEMYLPITSVTASSGLTNGYVATSAVCTSTGAGPINVDHLARMFGFVKTNSAGVFKLQFGSEVGGTQISVKAGSIMMVRKL